MKIPLLLTIICCLLALPAPAARVHMVGDIPSSELGLCLGLTKANKQGGAQAVSRVRISVVMKRLREMKLDTTRYLTPLKFDLVSSGRSNQFGGNRIVLSMGALDQYNNPLVLPVSTGTIVHEIGHWIGHSMDIRGKPAYEAFRLSAFRKCHGFDGYSTHFRDGRAHGNDLNETFAEAFSGYVTAPDFLKAACPAGYEFMRDQIFRGEFSPCPDPEKSKIPLPPSRPPEADLPNIPPLTGPIPLPRPRPQIPEEFIGPVVPLPSSSDGEHPIPLPPPRPKNPDENSGQSAAPL